jgi:hypothetical protein
VVDPETAREFHDETLLQQGCGASTAVCKNSCKSEQQTDLPGDKVQY